ncbi:MAG: hypothetical protein KUG69_08810 [Marinosulfonomonas sp.]|nr:hypothetical protein [Marinosulfonomonas sp.]
MAVCVFAHVKSPCRVVLTVGITGDNGKGRGYSFGVVYRPLTNFDDTWVMKNYILVLFLLPGCASPAFLNQPARDVNVADSVFRVYMRLGTSEVEAHRISFEMLPSRVLTYARAHQAITQATGCKVVNGSLEGDQAIIRASVDCVPQ